MNAKKVIYYMLMVLPLLAAIIALFYLPEKIPIHYGVDNEVTRWGSKYESLILPLTTIAFGFFMLAMKKISAKSETSGKNNEKVIIITGLVVLVVFNVLTAYFLYGSIKQITNLGDIPSDLYNVVATVSGAILIVVGNIMPKTKLNSVVGVRTSWSMKNELTWKKCQIFGGITFIIAGIIIMLTSIFIFKGISTLIWVSIQMGIVIIADVIYSYQVAKQN